ncbi:unnamed protein product [Vitrella brassicaformis CCMP3155]|uniref:Anaphase-promoting complex subunit 4-like WD40 domain-containing protein n=2 Tax=Vitrella brassicaformis TaxID=1169539 RepID=A0A0G4E9H0_VITBC|nr:unnamed protein product [Vitrella brassicaformis CCMP3155]|mmetsp:Transcript_54047/g.135913  ORF Transcript_54047/g.135913 Transcript_54047/m.135913 type:complete len:340 (+) Transcript_54047:82-1101(+)|eukprot:CEL91874.1 unnamed protein product [Vitrella brassicaformis CCMP3155]
MAVSPSRRTGKKITPRFILSDVTSEILCIRFSPDDAYLAAACSNGAIKIFNTSTGRQAYVLNQAGGSPTTQVRWRPNKAVSKTKNVLISVNSDGVVQHWHIASGKCLHQIIENHNQLFCCDYSEDGTTFAVAGKNREIHVYDEATKQLSTSLKGAEMGAHIGHANRVFSLKFNPTAKHLLVTGGWDHTVQVWDTRSQAAIRTIYGPFVAGDAVDIAADGDTILTGSWRPTEQLQLWDFGTGKKITDIPWQTADSTSREQCMVYAAEFSKDSTSCLIVAGGSGANEAKIFDRESDYAPLGTITSMAKGCYTVDFSCDSSMVAVAGGDGAIRVMNCHLPPA